MRRIFSLVVVALVMAAMMLAMAMPAFAGVQGGTHFGGFGNQGQGSPGGRHIGSGAGGGDAHIDQGEQTPPGGGYVVHNPH
jgi:hypothetical protein